jgi:hypothetical protein
MAGWGTMSRISIFSTLKDHQRICLFKIGWTKVESTAFYPNPGEREISRDKYLTACFLAKKQENKL